MGSELQEKEKEEIHYKNGIKVYKGQVQNNKRHGKGIEYYKNGKKKYEGDYFENTWHGKGIEYWLNGNKSYIKMRFHNNKLPNFRKKMMKSLLKDRVKNLES